MVLLFVMLLLLLFIIDSGGVIVMVGIISGGKTGIIGLAVLLFCGIILLTTTEDIACEGEEEEGYISGGKDGRMGLGINLLSSLSGMSDMDKGGGKFRMGVESQLGGVFGFRFIVVPGRRSVGWDWRCSMKVMW